MKLFASESYISRQDQTFINDGNDEIIKLNNCIVQSEKSLADSEDFGDT
jgi:hypothetical protein